MTIKEEYYTTTEAGKLLGVSRQWIGQLIRKELIRAEFVKGSGWLIPKREIEFYKPKA